jgi:L-ascorbate metabolism protein UlaG (beta-lactamase superfamily)
MFAYKDIKITWLGHDSFLIEAKGQKIYLDPYEIHVDTLPKADVVITTHEHGDHCNPDSINHIATDKTTLIGPDITLPILNDKVARKKEVKPLNPNGAFELDGISYSAIPAYNTHRFRSPGHPFHPKESGHIGPILNIDGTTIYHSGDTDKIPEMDGLKPTIALVPVSGTYVMDATECAQAVKAIQPEIAIPMHVGRGIGDLNARDQLKAALPDYHIEVLPMEM